MEVEGEEEGGVEAEEDEAGDLCSAVYRKLFLEERKESE